MELHKRKYCYWWGYFITNSGTSTISGVISESANLTKAGAGMLSLSGTNTYTGNTTVSAGTLRLSGIGFTW